MVSELFIIIRVAFVIVTTILFSIILVTYSRFRNPKLLFIAIGFGLFFIHALVSVPELLSNDYDVGFTDSFHLLLDTAGLIFVMLGTCLDMIFKKTQD
jgi:hypothetical protein